MPTYTLQADWFRWTRLRNADILASWRWRNMTTWHGYLMLHVLHAFFCNILDRHNSAHSLHTYKFSVAVRSYYLSVRALRLF